MDWIEARVARREDPAPGVAVLELVAADGSALPAYAAGAHAEVEIAEGVVRPYSLCAAPGQAGAWRIGVLREPASRGGSAALHQTFQQGRAVRVSSPRNLFPLHAGAEKALLLGGGIGITPMLAMAYELKARERPFELHYCVRSRAAAGFLDEIASAFAARATVHADDEGEAQQLVLDALLRAQPAGAHLYVCGPAGFMDFVLERAGAAGFGPERIHYEYFSAEVDGKGAPFEVVARRSGKTVQVGADESIIDALAKAGVKIKKSCEQGVCGTCLTDVLEGEPDHKDKFLNEEEREAGDQIIACCSRAKSARLVLDI
jgi:vanillate O-demethylase ferredoxin subunit